MTASLPTWTATARRNVIRQRSLVHTEGLDVAMRFARAGIEAYDGAVSSGTFKPGCWMLPVWQWSAHALRLWVAHHAYASMEGAHVCGEFPTTGGRDCKGFSRRVLP